MLLLIAEIGDLHLIARTVRDDSLLELSEFFDTLAVYADDYVTALNATLVGSAVGCNVVDIDSFDGTEINVLALFLLHVDVGADVRS